MPDGPERIEYVAIGIGTDHCEIQVPNSHGMGVIDMDLTDIDAEITLVQVPGDVPDATISALANMLKERSAKSHRRFILLTGPPGGPRVTAMRLVRKDLWDPILRERRNA